MLTRADLDEIRRAAKKNPQALLALPEDQQMAAAQVLLAAQEDEYRLDAWKWATEQVRTIDEASSSERSFPDWEYLHDLFDALKTVKKLALPKSRRMFVSWAVSTFLLHRIRYWKNVAGFIQSETETKSAYLIDKRMKWIEDHLSPLYRRPYEATRGVGGMVTTMTYAGTGSYAKALAQGADAFRAYTPTFVFLDEIEFMERGHESFVAALPFAEKDCQIVLCSSSGGPHGVLADMARSAGFTRFTG